MPGFEPAVINRHEVNKVADAGAWDKTGNLPLFAWAGAKAHPWKEISSLPSPPLPSGFLLPVLCASSLFSLEITSKAALFRKASLVTCLVSSESRWEGGCLYYPYAPPLSVSTCFTLSPATPASLEVLLPPTTRFCH